MNSVLRTAAISVGGITLILSVGVFVFRDQVFFAFVSDRSVPALGASIITAQLVSMIVNGFAGLIMSLVQATAQALAATMLSMTRGIQFHSDRAPRQPVVRSRRHHLVPDRQRGAALVVGLIVRFSPGRSIDRGLVEVSTERADEVLQRVDA